MHQALQLHKLVLMGLSLLRPSAVPCGPREVKDLQQLVVYNVNDADILIDKDSPMQITAVLMFKFSLLCCWYPMTGIAFALALAIGVI